METSKDSTNMVSHKKIIKIDQFQFFPFFQKIYEQLMYNNVLNFMNEKELIYKYQFGFVNNTQDNKQYYRLLIKLLKVKIQET